MENFKIKDFSRYIFTQDGKAINRQTKKEMKIEGTPEALFVRLTNDKGLRVRFFLDSIKPEEKKEVVISKDEQPKNTPERTVHLSDSIEWLKGQKNIKAIITSLPDMEEVGMNKEKWEEWIGEVCLTIMNSLDDNGVVIFYQTDRKYKGEVIDKKILISSHFTFQGYRNIFSKIVLKQKPETINLFRPTFSNMFGFSKKAKTGISTADVIFTGKMIYKNAMGYNACKSAVDFVKTKKISDTIVDPFCGQGSVLKIANDLGLHSIGIDILEDQIKIAANL